MHVILYYFTATPQGEVQGAGIVIAHPGKDVELLCDVTPSGDQKTAWVIDIAHGPYTVQLLHNGILTGYSSNGNNLIVQNITMNDNRNGSKYQCVTVLRTQPELTNIIDESDPTILYVAGEYFSS